MGQPCTQNSDCSKIWSANDPYPTKGYCSSCYGSCSGGGHIRLTGCDTSKKYCIGSNWAYPAWCTDQPGLAGCHCPPGTSGPIGSSNCTVCAIGKYGGGADLPCADCPQGSHGVLSGEGSLLQACKREDVPCSGDLHNETVAQQVETLAGNGISGFADAEDSTVVEFDGPWGVAVSLDGQQLFVADRYNRKIRAVHVGHGATKTLAGSGAPGVLDGTSSTARISPTGLAPKSDGRNVYVSECENHLIRKVYMLEQHVSTIAGSSQGFADGAAGAARFNCPYGLALSPDDLWLYVGDRDNHRIRKVSMRDGSTTTLAGTGTPGFADGDWNSSSFNQPCGVSTSPDGQWLYVADSGNNRVRKVNTTSGATLTLVGKGDLGSADGEAATVSLSTPLSVAASPDGRYLYIADSLSQRIRQVRLADGWTRTLAGSGNQSFSDGPPSESSFNTPAAIAVSPDGLTVYVADLNNERVRKIAVRDVCVACDLIPPVNTTGCASEASSPPPLNVSSESPGCVLNATWEEIVSRKHMTGKREKLSFATGGLGVLMDEDYSVWVCQFGHPCAATDDSSTSGAMDAFCFKYHEDREVFVPWARNSELKLIDPYS